jgi:hypothetical protein
MGAARTDRDTLRQDPYMNPIIKEREILPAAFF